MNTKYNTGDIVYAPVKIQSAREYDDKIFYTVTYPESGEKIPDLLPEDKVAIKEQLLGTAYISVVPDTSKIDEAVKQVEKFCELMNEAMKLADSIAHMKLDLRINTICNGKPAEFASISTE